MSGTESALWEHLLRAAGRKPAQAFVKSLARIETGSTRGGVSDVEYVIDRWHGWVELKTASVVREDSLLSLHCPFTLQQYQWLVTHHAPADRMRSWLLIGRMGPRTWLEWFLLPPSASVQFLHVRKPPTLGSVRRGLHAVRCENATEVLWHLSGGAW